MAVVDTENEKPRECGARSWREILDAYRTLCVAPTREAQSVLESIQDLRVA